MPSYLVLWVLFGVVVVCISCFLLVYTFSDCWFAGVEFLIVVDGVLLFKLVVCILCVPTFECLLCIYVFGVCLL